MKRILFIFILFIFPFSLTLAASPSSKLTTIAQIDLRAVHAGQVMEQPLTLQNTGDAVLEISSITSDCPCTTFWHPGKDGKYQPLLPESAITILPGDIVLIKLIFDSNKTKYQGVFKKLIIICSNDPGVPIKRVEMAGQLIP